MIINNVLYLGSSRRSSPGLIVNMSVEYEFDGNLFQSTILDLSENGSFYQHSCASPRQYANYNAFLSFPGGSAR